MILQRLGLGLLTLIAISILITLGVESLSGDVCTEILGQMAPGNCGGLSQSIESGPTCSYTLFQVVVELPSGRHGNILSQLP